MFSINTKQRLHNSVRPCSIANTGDTVTNGIKLTNSQYRDAIDHNALNNFPLLDYLVKQYLVCSDNAYYF